jgi:hypothetical protein
MEKYNDNFQKWSEKLSISKEEILQEFNSLVTETKNTNASLSQEQVEDIAVKKLALIYKKQLRSPATGFEGFVFGAEEPRDLIAKKRREAIEFFQSDPQSAVTNGITDEAGIPLDTIKVFSTGRANPNYGKPLPETSFVRRVFGVAKKANENPKLFVMNIQGDNCNKVIPVMKPVKFMAIDRTEQGQEVLTLNSSAYTEFREVKELEGNPNLEELIKGFYKVLKISELQNYHNSNKEDYNRVAVVQGTVSLMNLEPTSFGSRIIQLEDEADVLDLDAEPVTCWVPSNIDINFTEGSKVIVFGRTNQGFVKDEQGRATDELSPISINVFGIYSPEVFSTPIEKINEI